MRILLIATTSAALLGGASLAFAAGAESAVGVIKSIDNTAYTVTLKDGSTYWAPGTMNLSSFKPGEKVAITYIPSTVKDAPATLELRTLNPAA
jgi:Cu/Ag efflux protein CusF